MSGNVQQHMNRTQKKDDFRALLEGDREISLNAAIQKIYPSLPEKSVVRTRLMKYGTMFRQHQDTIAK